MQIPMVNARQAPTAERPTAQAVMEGGILRPSRGLPGDEQGKAEAVDFAALLAMVFPQVPEVSPRAAEARDQFLAPEGVAEGGGSQPPTGARASMAQADRELGWREALLVAVPPAKAAVSAAGMTAPWSETAAERAAPDLTPTVGDDPTGAPPSTVEAPVMAGAKVVGDGLALSTGIPPRSAPVDLAAPPPAPPDSDPAITTVAQTAPAGEASAQPVDDGASLVNPASAQARATSVGGAIDVAAQAGVTVTGTVRQGASDATWASRIAAADRETGKDVQSEAARRAVGRPEGAAPTRDGPPDPSPRGADPVAPPAPDARPDERAAQGDRPHQAFPAPIEIGRLSGAAGPGSPGLHHPVAAHQPDPAHLARQLAVAIDGPPDRPIELTLAPEELGKVRLLLSTAGETVRMIVQAERPETLDLMRRHIDQLAREFRDMGYGEVSFSFNSHPQQRQDRPAWAEQTEDGPAGIDPPRMVASSVASSVGRAVSTDGRLDLRM